MISKSSEEYLKTIYLLYKQNGNIRITDIANKMSHSKASVNKAVNILKDEKMLSYEKYGKIYLTKEGLELAKKLIEAYDIVYLFLKDVLNVEHEKAEIEAENMKAALSDSTINNLAKYAHKVLGLEELNCCYDINKEKCRKCSKTDSRKKKITKLRKEEARYGNK